MRGNPVVRLVLLLLFLGGAGLLVGTVAGPADAGKAARQPTAAQPQDDSMVVAEAYAQVRLSSPAERLVLDGEEIGAPINFDLRPGELVAELEFPMALRAGRIVANILAVEWADLSRSNFAHLTIEPDGLETRELTLHFPPAERTATVELRWPAEGD